MVTVTCIAVALWRGYRRVHTLSSKSLWQKCPKIPWGWIIVLLVLLPLLWPVVAYIGLAWFALMDYNIRGTNPATYGVLPQQKTPVVQKKMIRRNDNENRYKFFVETPRKNGWKVLPMKVDVDVPLDGRIRYLGLNVAMLGGSRIRYECPGYWSGGEVKLFAKADEPQFTYLAHEQTLNLYNTGSVTGGSAILIKGEKNPRYQGTSNRVSVQAYPLAGHTRIATTKVCESGFGYDWGKVQVGGKRTDSSPWEIYVRFADMNGFTLSDDLVQQKPGQIMIGVKKSRFEIVFDEVVSKPANQYGCYSVPEYEEDLFLRIQPPNVPEGRVIVEVILDIDNTK